MNLEQQQILKDERGLDEAKGAEKPVVKVVDQIKVSKDTEIATKRAELDKVKLEEVKRSLGISVEEKEQEVIEIGSLRFKHGADLYKESTSYSFPTYIRDGVSADHIKNDSHGRELYARPTEPYDLKMNFLRDSGVCSKKNIFTILGANWPLFYADLMGRDVSIMAVDENEKQVKFLDTFLQDLDKFDSLFEQNDMRFATQLNVPYYPTNYKNIKISLVERLKKLKAVRAKKAIIETRKKNEGKALDIKSKVLEMIKRGNFNVVVADVRRLAEDLDLNNVDFVDLSNVPELIGPEMTGHIINKLSSGTQVYMAFLNGSGLPIDDFIKKLPGFRLVNVSQTNNKMQRMVILEKI